jgi:glutamate/tyrosine decarboxylase-like PLP-dependent enzyme
MDFVSSSYGKIRVALEQASTDALPPPDTIVKATAKLPASLPSSGLGEEATQSHLILDVCPGFNGPKTSANYYGFVTGGVLPIAEVADNIVTAFDQNVGVHLPDQSISSIVEDRALSMLAELAYIGEEFQGRTFTTGATASNILGLACGREAIVKSRLEAAGESGSVGELGLLASCLKAGIKEIRVLTSMGHSSLVKAASVVGIGRASVKDLPHSKDEPWKLDIEALEAELKSTKDSVASIVALSAGEVNTGRFATDGLSTNRKVRELCDKYGAWFHVDAAFGLFARSLPPTPEFQALILSSSGLELADSIGGDCHKMLNVPYDCGVFYTRTSETLFSAFQNANAAYLSTGPSSIPSPLNIGLENSRRFRALPVYSVLLAYGRSGFAEIFAKQVRLARAISAYIDSHPSLELLAQGPPPSHPTAPFHHLSLSSPQPTGTNTPIERPPYENTHIIVIFRARKEHVNNGLVDGICGTRKLHVSGTSWQGKKAVRIAVSTWKVEVGRDLDVVKRVLEEVLKTLE